MEAGRWQLFVSKEKEEESRKKKKKKGESPSPYADRNHP